MLLDLLKNISDVKIELDKDLTKFNTMRLASRADLITVKSKDSLFETLAILNKNKIKYKVLGWGANQILPECAKHPFIYLDFEFDKGYLGKARETYVLPASLSLPVLSSHAVKNGLAGWEVFTGVPASLGGAVFMNAGTNLGEIGKIVESVKIATVEGHERIHIVNKDSFSYRCNNFLKDGEVIFEVTLKHLGIKKEISSKIKDYLELRNKSQPLKEFTCGCVFKNHIDESKNLACRVGQYLDIMDLKGLTYNGIKISPKHANFMENFGNARSEDAIALINFVKEELKLQYGIDFETEVELP